MAYVRTVRTKSGAVAVQIVWKSRQGGRDTEHLGSARTAAEVELLKAAGVQLIAAGQDEPPLGVAARQERAALPIVASRMGRLLDPDRGRLSTTRLRQGCCHSNPSFQRDVLPKLNRVWAPRCCCISYPLSTKRLRLRTCGRNQHHNYPLQ